jgi:hypothetical protein
MLSAEQLKPQVELINKAREVAAEFSRQTKENRTFLLILLRQAYENPEHDQQYKAIRTLLSDLDRNASSGVENGQVTHLRPTSGG